MNVPVWHFEYDNYSEKLVATEGNADVYFGFDSFFGSRRVVHLDVVLHYDYKDIEKIDLEWNYYSLIEL